MSIRADQDCAPIGLGSTQTDYPRDKCIHQLFEEQLENRASCTAVEFSGEMLTYSRLNARANQLAHYLRRTGVGPGALVGICLERSAQTIVAMLATLKAGGCYLPLDPSYPAERLQFMAGDAKAAVILSDRSRAQQLSLNEDIVVLLDEVANAVSAESQTNPTNLNKPDDLAYVIYTSGSTGRPKGICIPHYAVNRLVRNTNYIEIMPSDRIGQASNVSFDAATFEIWGALINGASVVGIPKEMTLTPRELVSEITNKHVNVLFLTTALFNQVAREVPDGFVSLRDLLFGGEAVDPQLVGKVLENGPPRRLLHVYGPTESTTFSSWYLVKSVLPEAATIPIGSAVSNTQIFVLDEARNPVKIGGVGELYIGGDGLATGYLNRPELTAERFVANPFDEASRARMYRTGDIGRLLPDNNIEFIGRADNQIKLRGFRIELGEIESALLRHANVANAVVLVQHDSAGEKILVAYIVPKDSSPPSLTDLRAHLKQSMPDYMIPAAFALVQAFPLTPNGKTDREALKSTAAVRAQLETAFVEPNGELEESLAAIWREVLCVEKVGRNDNFFDLGGHSLSILRVHEQLMDLVGRRIPIAVLFQHSTVGSLAKYVCELQEGTKPSARLKRLEDRAVKRKSVLARRAKHRSQVA